MINVVNRGLLSCMLRPAILLTAILLIPNCFPRDFRTGGAFQSRDPSPVDAEEYAAYSAFINQKYIPSRSTPIYTLQGSLIEDGELEKKGRVLIAANTQQEFANIVGVNRYMLQLFMGQEANNEAEQTFDDLIAKNGRAARLSNKFNLTIRYELAGDKELGPELYRLKSDQDKFLDRFPRSKGLLSFSRVGFDAARRTALFLVAQLDVSSRRDRNPSESTYLVLLNKEGGQWKVNKMWGPQRKSLVINLARCDQTSRAITLAFGSESFRVIGRAGDGCLLEHEREIERGYTRTRCRVPVGLGKLTVFESDLEDNVFTFSIDMSKYCESLCMEHPSHNPTSEPGRQCTSGLKFHLVTALCCSGNNTRNLFTEGPFSRFRTCGSLHTRHS